MANIKLKGVNGVMCALSDALMGAAITVENLSNKKNKYHFQLHRPLKAVADKIDVSKPHERVIDVTVRSGKYSQAILDASPDIKSDSADLSFQVRLYNCTVDSEGVLSWGGKQDYSVVAGGFEPNFIFYKDGNALNFVEEGECFTGDFDANKDRSQALMLGERIMKNTSEADRISAFKYMIANLKP